MFNLFNPKTIAVIGASRNPEKVGNQILNILIKNGFTGKIFPVNPEATEILNLRSYKSVLDIEAEIDLALIVVPATLVPNILSECVKKQVKFAVIISSGFAESNQSGKDLQAKIQDIVKASNTRVIGPNCLGVFNTNANFNATFAAPKLTKGGVSAIFQSGALGVALLDWCEKYNFGFSKFVSLGNKIDIEETELLQFLADDPDTQIIAMYLEDIKDPQKFLTVARYATEKKPVVILKGGMTNLGAKAAQSHTASMIKSSHTTEAIFAQSNLIVARTIEDMLNCIQILSSEPQIISRNMLIITNAGGPGILATDMASKLGLDLFPIDEKDTQKLAKNLSVVASIHNPLDLAGDAKAKDYEIALKYGLENNNYSSILVLLTPQSATEIKETAEVLANYSKYPKPIIASFLGDSTIQEGLDILNQYQIPHFSDPEIAVFTINKLAKYWENVWKKKYLIEIEKNQGDPANLTSPMGLIQNYNITVPAEGIATDINVAYQIVERIGYPVAVKNIGKFGEHKFKAGKVKLNIFDQNALNETIKQIGFPVLIQKMVDFPFEVMIGAKRDPQMGIVLTFGWGGVFVEDLDDLVARILPLTESDLDEMIRETKIGKILVREKIDLSGIKNILVAVAQIMADYPQIGEMDLNPVKVSENQTTCVDARYILNQ